MKRWAITAIAGVVVLAAAAGIVAWRKGRDDLCDVPAVAVTPSTRLPAATAPATLHPRQPPPNAAYPLLYHAVRYPGGRRLGRLRWVVHTASAGGPALHASPGAAVVLVGAGTAGHEIAAYRTADGRLLWRLTDARLDATYNAGDIVVIQRTLATGEGATGRFRVAAIGLDARTGQTRWCRRDRRLLGGRAYLPGSGANPYGSGATRTGRGRLVLGEATGAGAGARMDVVAADTGTTAALVAPPPGSAGDEYPPTPSVGADTMAVRWHNALWVYGLGDGRLRYHVTDLPHPVPKAGQAVAWTDDRAVVAPGRVVVESEVSARAGEDDAAHGAHHAYLATAYDDGGRVVWRLSGPEPGVLSREPAVFGDAVIVHRGFGAVEARRLSDGGRLWRRPGSSGWSWDRPLTVGGSYLYGVDQLGVTAIDRSTGERTTIPMCCAEPAGGDAVLGPSPILLATDPYTIAAFEMP